MFAYNYVSNKTTKLDYQNRHKVSSKHIIIQQDYMYVFSHICTHTHCNEILVVSTYSIYLHTVET